MSGGLRSIAGENGQSGSLPTPPPSGEAGLMMVSIGDGLVRAYESPVQPLALLAFQRLLTSPRSLATGKARRDGSTGSSCALPPLQLIDPSELKFFNEAGENDFFSVEKAGLTSCNSEETCMPVCIKSFKPHVLTTPQELRSVVEEARRIVMLRHANLCSLLGMGCYSCSSMADVRSSIFMVERWAGSTTLYAALRKSQQSSVSRGLTRSWKQHARRVQHCYRLR